MLSALMLLLGSAGFVLGLGVLLFKLARCTTEQLASLCSGLVSPETPHELCVRYAFRRLQRWTLSHWRRLRDRIKQK